MAKIIGRKQEVEEFSTDARDNVRAEAGKEFRCVYKDNYIGRLVQIAGG